MNTNDKVNYNRNGSKRTINGYNLDYRFPYQAYDTRQQMPHSQNYSQYNNMQTDRRWVEGDYPPKNYSPRNYQPQNYPPQNYPPQNYPPRNYQPQNYPPQNYPPQKNKVQIQQPSTEPKKYKHFWMKPEFKEKIKKIVEIMDIVRKIIKASIADKSAVEILKEQLEKVLKKHNLGKSALKKIFAIFLTIAVVGGISMYFIDKNKPEPKVDPRSNIIPEGSVLVDQQITEDGYKHEKYILPDGTTILLYLDSQDNYVLHATAAAPQIDTSNTDINTSGDVAGVENQIVQDKNSYVDFVDKLSDEFVAIFADSIRAGNSNVPNTIYSFAGIDKNKSDREMVRIYLERMDASKKNPYNNNTILYHTPNVLRSIIKYYYHQTKKADMNNVTIYYRENEGKVYAATVQEGRYASDPDPKILRTARDKGKRLSNIDEITLSYATLDNVVDKVGFVEADSNPVVLESISDMHEALPGLLKTIIENEKANDYDEI
ncbi:MAG: DUF3824 domain-containing protein [Clostridia bacterium]|nr:DUF3824 domain-containing protein [Clostridia bacterium]